MLQVYDACDTAMMMLQSIVQRWSWGLFACIFCSECSTDSDWPISRRCWREVV